MFNTFAVIAQSLQGWWFYCLWITHRGFNSSGAQSIFPSSVIGKIWRDGWGRNSNHAPDVSKHRNTFSGTYYFDHRNTENTFHGALGENEVVIAPIHQFLMWRGYYASKRKPVPPSSWKISKQYADYRLIAFPVHISNPLHFTLGIMVNLKWKPGAKYRKASSWTLLHLDSCPCNRNSQIYALGFGKYLLELDSNTKVKVIEVPVIKQALNSNDCGFYPAHFLDIILQDVDFYIQQCIEVSRASPFLNMS